MTNRPMVVLFFPARDALPSEPEFAGSVVTGETSLLVHAAAKEIGYDVD